MLSGDPCHVAEKLKAQQERLVDWRPALCNHLFTVSDIPCNLESLNSCYLRRKISDHLNVEEEEAPSNPVQHAWTEVRERSNGSERPSLQSQQSQDPAICRTHQNLPVGQANFKSSSRYEITPRASYFLVWIFCARIIRGVS